MRWKEASDQYCSVARAMAVLGDRWTLLIVREAFAGVRRFDDFRTELGVARNILTDRLKRLVDAGILEVRQYQDNPPRHEYRLTPRGADLNAVLLSLMAWGDRWMAEEAGPPILIQHTSCGHTIAPELHCPECGGALTPRNVRLLNGPGLPKEAADARDEKLARLTEQRSRSTK